MMLQWTLPKQSQSLFRSPAIQLVPGSSRVLRGRGKRHGLTTIASELSGKRLELLKGVVPRFPYSFLLNPSSSNGPPRDSATARRHCR